MHTRKHSVLTRLLATLLVVVTMIGIVGYVPEARAATDLSTMSINEIKALIPQVHKQALKNTGRSSFSGYCGLYTKQQLSVLGIGYKGTGDFTGNKAYAGLTANAVTSSGFKQIKYPGSNCLADIVKANNNEPVYNIVVSMNGGSTSYGHVYFIYAIIDGKVYWSENSTWGGIKEGQVRVNSVSQMQRPIQGSTYSFIGAVHFYKNNEYSIINNQACTGISIKPASGEDQCYIKEKPFEDSNNKAPSVPKGDTVKIVGAVKNKYGNIWYKTEDGGYVYSGDIIFFQDYFSISAKFKNTEKRSARKYPFEDSDAVKKIGKDDIVQVSKFVLNSYGNIWAQLTDGSYLCFYDKNSGENKLKFSAHVTQPTHSTTYPQGNIKVTANYGFLFKGDVKAEVPFLSLTARVIDRETEQDVSATGSPCTLKPGSGLRTINLEKTKIDGKTMDNIVLIRKLNGSSGWYRYELNAQFGFTYEGKTFKFGNEYNFVSSNFSVGKAGETEPNFSTDPFDQFSSLFTLSAKFKNTEKRSSHEAPYLDSPDVKTIGKDDIVEVMEFVTNSHGNIWAKLTDGSYLCFYDQETGENKMKFSAHVTEPSHSTTYPEGDIKVTANYGFLFKGDVKAEVPFLSLTARVIDRETEQDVSATGSPCTLKPGSGLRTINLEKTKIDGKTMDNIVLIRKLNGSSGWYRYELNAQFGFTYEGKTFKFGNEYNFVSSNFSVGNPGELETTPTPEVKGKLTIGNATRNGDVLEIPVGVQDNPGLVGVSVEIDIPDDFFNFNADTMGIGANAMIITDGVNGGNKVALLSTDAMTGDGDLFKLYLPLDGVDLTEFTLKVKCTNAGEANGNNILLSSAEKLIQISSDRLPGDANEDGAVGWPDLILMLKYVSGWSVTINTSNADVTADGSVGWTDLILLLKYVSGWNVELK